MANSRLKTLTYRLPAWPHAKSDRASTNTVCWWSAHIHTSIRYLADSSLCEVFWNRLKSCTLLSTKLLCSSSGCTVNSKQHTPLKSAVSAACEWNPSNKIELYNQRKTCANAVWCWISIWVYLALRVMF